MNGFVDDNLRALVRNPVSASRDGSRENIVAWIDTAFNGGLVIPQRQIAELGLVKQSSAEAILADGHTVELETFACFFEWFGSSYETQVVANDGEYPLLGTMLLEGHRLFVVGLNSALFGDDGHAPERPGVIRLLVENGPKTSLRRVPLTTIQEGIAFFLCLGQSLLFDGLRHCGSNLAVDEAYPLDRQDGDHQQDGCPHED